MPAFNGTGPLDKGPLTGKGEGFCILKKTDDYPFHTEGCVGIEGTRIFMGILNRKEINTMPRGDG
ncbi:DUF5320 domain-containing protein, partial [candidate division KSB1 bacterium]|nr:DUF5320 domain-containing protein [candidate division KSB1 bacterium]